MLLAVHIIVAVSFVILGIVFSRGKGMFLIAGYNTASAAEKAKYDEKKLCRAMSRLMFALDVCFLVIAFGDIFDTALPRWVGPALIFLVAAVGIVYIQKGCRKDAER